MTAGGRAGWPGCGDTGAVVPPTWQNTGPVSGPRRLTLACALSLLVASGGGFDSRVRAQGLNANDALRVHRMLQEAYDSVRRNYYDPAIHGLDWDARFHAYEQKVKRAPSLNAGLALVAEFLDGLQDSHTYFSPPARPYRIDYGYRLALVGDKTMVVRVRPGTDAEGKVHPGDRVLALDGLPVTRQNLARAEYLLNTLAPRQTTRLRLRDPPGAEREVVVTTKVVPGRQFRDLTGSGRDLEAADLVREQEAADRVYRQQYAELGDVMIWKMPVFLLNNGEVDKLFSIARRHATLILDLREDPGGLINTLERMLGNLFDHDVPLFTRVTRKGRRSVVVKSRGASAYTGKLIVLVDSASASSAELLARVVQLEGRGTVVGDRSAGAVREARLFPFTQGDQVVIFYGFAVTDADLIMRDGHSLEGAGVVPDTLVLPSPADLAAGRDPVLARAAHLAGVALDPDAAGRLFPYEWVPLGGKSSVLSSGSRTAPSRRPGRPRACTRPPAGPHGSGSQRRRGLRGLEYQFRSRSRRAAKW